MVRYEKVRTLDLEKAAYIAGLVDSEGTITLVRRNKGQHRRACLTISNNDLQLLMPVKEDIGVGVITTKKHYK